MTLSLHRQFRAAAVIVGCWLVAAVFFSWHYRDLARARGETIRYVERLSELVVVMLLWAVFTPLLMYLGDLFPFRKPRRARNALILAAVAAAVAIIRSWIDVALGLALGQFFTSVNVVFHAHLIFALLVLGVARFIRLEKEELARQHQQVRGEAEAAEARLYQLRADLNPHFLFNTMNAVATLLHADPAAAEQMLAKLRDFLRRAASAGDAREVRLADELEFVSRYFDIQTMRFGRKLTTRIHVADRRLYDAAVPPLLLQPLVENAIVHGVARRRDGGAVAVVVDQERTAAGEWLRIEIRDNGPGCAPEAVFAKGRVGVANAMARLESIYGNGQSLVYERGPDAFVARILIPLRLDL